MGSKSIILRKFIALLARGHPGLCYYPKFIISNSSLRMWPEPDLASEEFRENVPWLVNDYLHTNSKFNKRRMIYYSSPRFPPLLTLNEE